MLKLIFVSIICPIVVHILITKYDEYCEHHKK